MLLGGRQIWREQGSLPCATAAAGLRLEVDHSGHHLRLFAIVFCKNCAYVFWLVFCSFGWPVVCGVAPVVCGGFVTPVGLVGLIELEAAEVPVVEAGPLAAGFSGPPNWSPKLLTFSLMPWTVVRTVSATCSAASAT